MATGQLDKLLAKVTECCL